MSYSDGTPGVSYSYDRQGHRNTITDAAGTRNFQYNLDHTIARLGRRNAGGFFSIYILGI
ncbi:hypothetical protein [Victivallis sp. Marseille-Q1083]|uniref:hypothetical protein n=1 Tax=Victivallis sp. Marseille-Q1083 TaxID=2717288 RepID=UPI0034C6A25E